MMNKNIVISLLDKQEYPVIKKKIEKQEYSSQVLLSLGVKKDSEFYELYTQYFLRLLDRRSGTPEMIDPCPPQDMLGTATFAHKNWGIPKNYILFTTGEGEGGYFYNVDNNSVWDCGLGEQHLLGTDQLKHWDSFYEFMVCYLTIDE